MTTIYKFYGVDNNFFKLDDTIYEVVEDPDDGYRSYMRELRVVPSSEGLIFNHTPIAEVIWNNYDEDLNMLIDASTGHVWLRFGTNTDDSYYPWCVFEYTPALPTT